MQIPLALGRVFDHRDAAGAPPRFIVNQAFADQYLRGASPLSRRLRLTLSPDQPFREIVGVVANENVDQPGAPMQPILYDAFETSPQRSQPYVVRAAGDPALHLRAIRSLLRSLDPELAMVRPRTMQAIIAEAPAVFLRRMPSYLIGSFALLALLLVVVGLYGLLSFSVVQRTREIGIRVALGAPPRGVLALVVGEGLMLTLLGLAWGTAAAVLAAHSLRSLLFAIGPADPATLLLAAAVLGAVSLLASYLPARKALRVDPMVVLR
jgi:putative ABC transport system permease protein